MSITGLPGQGPVRVGIPITDLCAGMFLAQGILLALLDREKTGKGQWVHTSLLEAMTFMLDSKHHAGFKRVKSRVKRVTIIQLGSRKVNTKRRIDRLTSQPPESV